MVDGVPSAPSTNDVNNHTCSIPILEGTHPNQTTVPLPAWKCKTDAAGRAFASNIRSAAVADEMLTPTCNATHNGVPCQAWTACLRTCSNAVINSYFRHLCILDGQELHVGEDLGTGRGALRA